MVNLLIANSDILDAKRVVNTVIRRNKELRLIDIVTNEKEAMQAVLEEYPDVIIINQDLFNVAKRLKNSFYAPVILESNKIKTFEDVRVIVNNISSQKKSDEPKEMEKKESEDLPKKVYNLLLKLNFNPKMKGTQYLLESILFTYLNYQDNVIPNLSKYVYPEIGAKHNETSDVVKWDIIKSVKAMIKENAIYNPDIMQEVFQLSTPVKITPKVLISNIIAVL